MLIPSFKHCCCCWPPVARLLAPGLYRMSLIYKISFIKTYTPEKWYHFLFLMQSRFTFCSTWTLGRLFEAWR